MIYTVTLNPAIDCALNAPHYRPGMVNRAESETITAGGKGINMSIILNRLGIDTMALGFCAGDTGKLLCKLLDEIGCPHDLTVVEGQSTRVNMKLRTPEGETEVNGKGPYISTRDLSSFADKLCADVKTGDTVIFAGSVPDGISSGIYADIMDALKDKKVKTVVDASGNLLRKALPKKPFLVKPNNIELSEFLGREIKDRGQALEGAKELQQAGAHNVLVSLAGEGAVLLTEKGESYEIEAPSGIVKNSVGAGDAMVAGYAAGLEIFGDSLSALKLGTAAGSATAFSESLAEKDDIEQILSGIDSSLTLK